MHHFESFASFAVTPPLPSASGRIGFLRGTPVQHLGGGCTVRCRTVQTVSARYRGYGADMSRVPEFKTHGTDCGSPQYQIARLSARVQQLTKHLQTHKKDYACERGLKKVLATRKRLLRYLYDNDRSEFQRVIKDLGIRFSVQKFTAG